MSNSKRKELCDDDKEYVNIFYAKERKLKYKNLRNEPTFLKYVSFL